MIKIIMVYVGKIICFLQRIKYKFIRCYQLSKLSKSGKNVYISENCTFTYENIEIGDNVYIGKNCIFQSTYGKIIIGNNVMFGPGVNIHCGNHIIDEIGKLMNDVRKKNPGDDGLIIIEDDCWIGSNAIILSNTRIGKGSVVGAGAIVTKDIPTYSIYTGSPTKQLRPRFNDEDLEKHINLMSKRYNN